MERPRIRMAVFVIGLGIVTAACTYLTGGESQPYRLPGVASPAAGADAGAVLYGQDCAWCHGPEGEGTTRGPDLNGELDGAAYTDFMLRTGRMPLDDPDTPSSGGPPRYDDRQIAAIVAYVESFGGTGPAVPSPDPDAGDLVLGQGDYQANCAACHSTTGIGGALTSGQIAPSLDDVTPREIAEAMLVGPGCPVRDRTCGPGSGAMPRFDFSPKEVDSIVRYVQTFRQPDDAGGFPIGWVGPVAEGAVALLIGLGLLIVVVRWIGTRVGDEP